ncbi:MAG: hypothetical protein GWP10_17585 [Nitrospiraceae bacterium]|nr:hypothetical protein [Nitrospiraceae bacterium]
MSEKKINIPPKIGWYLAGFADGEGSFNVSFRPREDYRNKWKIFLSFNISQDEKLILTLFKRYLGCGTLRMGKDGIWYYEVTGVNAISEKVIPFFKKFHFLSQKKKKTFSKFKRVLEMVLNGEHLTENGIKKIAKLREEINGDHSKRKYNSKEIISSLEESSETIR